MGLGETIHPPSSIDTHLSLPVLYFHLHRPGPFSHGVHPCYVTPRLVLRCGCWASTWQQPRYEAVVDVWYVVWAIIHAAFADELKHSAMMS